MTGGKVLGVGSPLLDYLAEVDESFLVANVHGAKGGMEMIEPEAMAVLLSKLPATAKAPGGSAGNTIFALAKMGVQVAMFGKVGSDADGDFYCRRLVEAGGSDLEFRTTGEAPTGSCLSLITTDAERTMRSQLGASLLLNTEEAMEVDFSQYSLVYIEGYMLFSPVLPVVLQRAKAAGCQIGFDLASFEVVRSFKYTLPELIKNYVDIVIANQEEAYELLSGTPAEQLSTLSQWSNIAVIKLGKSGSMVQSGQERVQVPAELVNNPVDTTAAGDLWAAGFIYGLITGKNLKTSASYGSLFSSQVVQVIGSVIPQSSWEYISRRVCN